jgi:hypothetical protein
MQTTPEPKYKTREEWLNAACALMKPYVESKGGKWVPVRVSVGWPSKNALSSKKRAIGQCWSPECSADKTTEIFISPCLGEATGTDGAILTLLHELVHAVVGNKCGHRGAFASLARGLGFLPPMTHTPASPELLEYAVGIADQLGPYPHATLDQTKSGIKKQTTRMIKAECLCAEGEGTCGFKIRASRKVLLEIGIPVCPKHRVGLFADIPEEDKSDGDHDDHDQD